MSPSTPALTRSAATACPVTVQAFTTRLRSRAPERNEPVQRCQWGCTAVQPMSVASARHVSGVSWKTYGGPPGSRSARPPTVRRAAGHSRAGGQSRRSEPPRRSEHRQLRELCRRERRDRAACPGHAVDGLVVEDDGFTRATPANTQFDPLCPGRDCRLDGRERVLRRHPRTRGGRDTP